MENKKKIGRPPSKNPRDIQVKIRMNKEEFKKLEFCSNEERLSKTEIINQGIEKIYQEIQKKK